MIMSQASKFKNNHASTDDLMTALDAANLDKDQDWDIGATSWFFDDGSKIVICGPDVEIFN